MSASNDFDLEMPLAVFVEVVGVGWQLPDVAHARLCVIEDALFQRLVVRVGPWELSPPVTYNRACGNYPGLRVRLGDLRDACRNFRGVWTDLDALEGIGPDSCASAETVKVRFGPSAVAVWLCDARFEVEGE